MRHRRSIAELTVLAATVLVVVYVVFEFDVFFTQGAASGATLRFELDEILLLGTLLATGLLIVAWRRTTEIKAETRRRLASEQALRVLASQDPLTGLANRRQFSEALGAALAAPPGAASAHAVLMLDLNSFKQINDAHGHGTGDRVLTIVGERLRRVVRDGDLVARLGGDEFAVLMHHTSAEGATSVALRIIELLAEPLAVAGRSHRVGAGIGICLFPFVDDSSEEVMRRADVALYKAKVDRPSSLRFFDDEMDRRVRERTHMEEQLRAAIEAGDIHPHFQPLVDLATQRVVGFEALARWTHPEFGDVEPERFIPIAEDAGLIDELTDVLLREACRAALAWPPEVTLSFNISPSQLRNRSLGLRVLAVLGEVGLLPQRLEIEITESALVRDLDAAQAVLGALREVGVRIALDDFGTGYSSLYHLRNFKLDKIKIDRSFIAGMGREKESAEIVLALVGLGRGLGLTVTAEGIEGSAQEQILRDQGCQQGQGFLFSEAVPAADTARFFAIGGAWSHGA